MAKMAALRASALMSISLSVSIIFFVYPFVGTVVTAAILLAMLWFTMYKMFVFLDK